MKKLLALSLAAGFGLLVAPSSADACRCMYNPDPISKRDRSDAVFYGTVHRVSGNAFGRGTGMRTFTFKVMRGYKGIATKNVTVKSQASSAACGANFSRGGSYLVYAGKNDATLSTSSCSGNTSGSTARAEMAKLGQYWVPQLPNGACPAGSHNVIRCIRAPCTPVKCMVAPPTTVKPTSATTASPR